MPFVLRYDAIKWILSPENFQYHDLQVEYTSAILQLIEVRTWHNIIERDIR